MKRVFLLLILFIAGIAGQAQSIDTIFYDGDWEEIPGRPGAAYYRLFDHYDAVTNRNHFKDFYISGKLQSICSYLNTDAKSKDGTFVWYYEETGHISAQGSYNKGYKTGEWSTYFPDGQLRDRLIHYSEKPYVKYLECYDQDRNHILTAGDGMYVEYWENGNIYMEGPVEAGLKSGTWTGYKKDGSKYYVEKYENGILVKGVAWYEDGKVKYKKSEVMPEFKGGQSGLMNFLASIKYPTKALENDIEGSVYVKFIVDKDGKVVNVGLARSSGSEILDKAAVDHIASSPKWKPGTQRGKGVKVEYTVPIKFKLN